MKRRCKTCGEELDPGMNFCPNCGQPSDEKEDQIAIQKELQEIQEDHLSNNTRDNGKTMMILLAVLALSVVAILGTLMVKMLRNDGVQPPQEPTVDTPVEKDPSTTKPQVPQEEEIPQSSFENEKEEENQAIVYTENLAAFGENFQLDRIEVKKEKENLRLTLYYETSVPLSVSLVDNLGNLNIGPIDLGSDGGYAYFDLNANYFNADQLMILLNQSNDPKVAGEITIEKDALKQYLE